MLPNVICGDLDSIRPNVHEFYSKHGVSIQHMPDQDSTDFQKCLLWLHDLEKSHGWDPLDLLALGAFGGRLDQTLSHLHTLYTLETNRRAFLTDLTSVAWLLRPNAQGPPTPPGQISGEPHVIECYDCLEGPSLGLVPLGTTLTTCKTTGLKWNLGSHLPMAFGKMVSTSNTFDGQSVIERDGKKYHVIQVWTDQPIIFTAHLNGSGSLE